MTEDAPHLTVTEAEGVKIVEFSDRKILEELAISEIGDELVQLVESSDDPRLLLSFRNVQHLSSAALGMLIKLNNQVQEKNGTLRLSNISPQIYEVFKITRLNKLFDIHESLDDALASF